MLVGEETDRASRHALRYQERDPVRLKGKADPIRSWLAAAPRTGPADRPISELPIGERDGELDLLERIWARVATDRAPHLATLLGPPGIGKSKVARAFLERVSDGRGRTW